MTIDLNTTKKMAAAMLGLLLATSICNPLSAQQKAKQKHASNKSIAAKKTTPVKVEVVTPVSENKEFERKINSDLYKQYVNAYPDYAQNVKQDEKDGNLMIDRNPLELINKIQSRYNIKDEGLAEINGKTTKGKTENTQETNEPAAERAASSRPDELNETLFTK